MPNESKWWDSRGLSYSGQESCRERCCRFTWHHGKRPQNHLWSKRSKWCPTSASKSTNIWQQHATTVWFWILLEHLKGRILHMILPWHADLVTFDSHSGWPSICHLRLAQCLGFHPRLCLQLHPVWVDLIGERAANLRSLHLPSAGCMISKENGERFFPEVLRAIRGFLGRFPHLGIP